MVLNNIIHIELFILDLSLNYKSSLSIWPLLDLLWPENRVWHVELLRSSLCPLFPWSILCCYDSVFSSCQQDSAIVQWSSWISGIQAPVVMCQQQGFTQSGGYFCSGRGNLKPGEQFLWPLGDFLPLRLLLTSCQLSKENMN